MKVTAEIWFTTIDKVPCMGWTISYTKTCSGQKVPEPSNMREETVAIDIFIATRMVKMQLIRITSSPPTRI